MGKNKEIQSVLEITRTHVKHVQARPRQGRPALFRCDIVKLDGDSASDVMEALSRIRGLKESGDFIIIIPRRHCILKRVTFPSQAEEEIRQMISLQVSKLCPYSRDEVLFDYLLLEKLPSGHAHVLVVIVPKEIVDFYLQVVRGCGLEPKEIVLSSLGLLDWYAYQQEKQKRETASSVMIMDIDQASTEVVFCRWDELIFSRVIPLGNQDLSTEAMDAFLEQVTLTVETFKKEYEKELPQKIIVVADTPKMVFLQKKIEELFQVPVTIFFPLDNIPCHRRFSFPELRPNESVSIVKSLGPLLKKRAPQMNLMPREIIENEQRRLKRKARVTMGFWLILIYLLGVAIYAEPLYKMNIQLDQLKEQAKVSSLSAKQAEEKIRFIEFAQKGQANSIPMVDFIRELYRLTPPEISYRSLDYNVKGTLEIQGFADTGATVTDFQGQLVDSALFKDVTLKYATKRRRLKEEFTEFNISCQFVSSELGEKTGQR